MGPTEERRDVFRLLKLAAQAVLDGSAQSATPGEKTIYIKAATVIEMEAALAEAERERDYWEKNWNEDAAQDFVRLRQLEKENTRLQAFLSKINELQSGGRYLSLLQAQQVREALHRAREFSGPYDLAMRDTFDAALSILGWRGGEK